LRLGPAKSLAANNIAISRLFEWYSHECPESSGGTKIAGPNCGIMEKEVTALLFAPLSRRSN
jgi:hypothetical protein